MYRCTRCGAGFNPRTPLEMDLCPRCLAKHRIASPLAPDTSPRAGGSDPADSRKTNRAASARRHLEGRRLDEGQNPRPKGVG